MNLAKIFFRGGQIHAKKIKENLTEQGGSDSKVKMRIADLPDIGLNFAAARDTIAALMS
jgi:hypothetical protein